MISFIELESCQHKEGTMGNGQWLWSAKCPDVNLSVLIVQLAALLNIQASVKNPQGYVLVKCDIQQGRRNTLVLWGMFILCSLTNQPKMMSWSSPSSSCCSCCVMLEAWSRESACTTNLAKPGFLEPRDLRQACINLANRGLSGAASFCVWWPPVLNGTTHSGQCPPTSVIN